MNQNCLKIEHVVIPAAGYGTRLLPGSKAIPKEMFPIVNKPAIEYIADEAKKAGINNIILITSSNKESLVDHFDNNFELESILKKKNKDKLLKSITKYDQLNLINVRQRKALGLGHAVHCASHIIIERPFGVILPDMFVVDGYKYMKKMCELYEQSNGKGVIALMKVPHDKVSSYGIIKGTPHSDFNDENIINIEDMIEKPSIDEAPSNLAILGRYILPNKVMDILKYEQIDHSGEIQLTNSLRKLTHEDGLIGLIVDAEIHDIGSPNGFIKANISYALKNSEYKDEILEYIKSITL